MAHHDQRQHPRDCGSTNEETLTSWRSIVNAVTESSRQMKPEPSRMSGFDGIPIRHEIELEYML